MSKTLLKMTKSVANIIDKNAASAAHWLKSGGCAWWTHVTNTSKIQNMGDPTSSDDEEEPIQKPRGSRSQRKTLATQKHHPEFSDISSDDDVDSKTTVKRNTKT